MKDINMRDIKSGRNSTMPRYDNEGKIWSDSLGEYVWEKVEYKDGDTYTWDDVNLLYWNDNGDEGDYLMITTDEGLPINCTPIKNSRKVIKSNREYILREFMGLPEDSKDYVVRRTGLKNVDDVIEKLSNNDSQVKDSVEYVLSTELTSSKKSIKSGYEDYDDYDDMDLDDMVEDCMANLHQSNIEEGCERIRNSIRNSEVEYWIDCEDCFVDVTQFNNTTGNSTTWSFCIDFGSDTVYMLEPFESKPERFDSDYNAFSIIQTMLKGGYKIQSSRKSIKSGYYDDPVNHPEGGGVCDYCGAEIAPGDGYEEDFDSTWEEARSQLYAALTDDEPYNAPQSEWEFAGWLGEDWSDDDVHDVLGEIVDMAYRGGKYPRYMCPDCNRKRIKEAAEKWVEENW